MAPAVAAALVAGVVAVATTIITVLAGRQLEQRRRDQDRTELIRRYRDPLLRSAYDLQSRLWNIVRQRFLDVYYINGGASERSYAVGNTLYVIGEFFAWIEILRRDLQFLDLGEESMSKRLVDLIEEIRDKFSRDDIEGRVFRVFRGEQRAIGEVMSITSSSTTGDPPRPEAMGYASFTANLETPDLARWFSDLKEDIEDRLTNGDRHDETRLIVVQRALIDLLEFLDPDCLYFQAEKRTRIP